MSMGHTWEQTKGRKKQRLNDNFAPVRVEEITSEVNHDPERSVA